MLITVDHKCEENVEKYDFLVVSLIEFVSGSKLTGQERSFLLELMSINRSGDNPFHRSSFNRVKDAFNFKRPSQRIYRLKVSLRNKGYLNGNLSDFSDEVSMLMEAGDVDLKISIKK